MSEEESLLNRLRTRAAIRRKLRFARDQVGKDKISDLLDEAADEIEALTSEVNRLYQNDWECP